MIAGVWSNRTLVWETDLRGTATDSNDRARSVVVDSAGDIVALGRTENVAPLLREFTVVKLSAASGAQLWRRIIKGTASRDVDVADALAVDAAGDVVAAGAVENRETFRDFIVVKLSRSDGSELWRQVISGRGSESSDEARGLVIDAAGDVVAAGGTSNSETGDSDFTVLKFSGETGAELWRRVVRGMVGGLGSGAVALAWDGTGDIVAGGYLVNSQFRGADFAVVKLAGFDGREIWRATIARELGFSSLVVDRAGDIVATGSSGFFVAKFAGASGAELWQQEIGAADSATASAVTVDSAGDVLAVGGIPTSETQQDAVVKLSGATGEELWRGTGRCTDLAFSASSVSIDGEGDIVAAGTIPTSRIAPSGGTALHFTVTKLAATTGQEVWCQMIEGSAPGRDSAIALALSSTGDIAAAGVTANIGSGPGDFTVAKLDGTNGTELWRTLIDGSASLSRDQSVAIALDRQGDAVSAGSIRNAGTSRDFAVVKLGNASGTVVWRREISGTAIASNDQARAVAVDTAGDIVAAGVTQNVDTGSDFTVAKLGGADGRDRWQYTLTGTADGLERANAVAVDLRRDVVAAGQIENATTHSDFAVIKVAGTTGAEIWRQLFNGTANGVDIANAVTVDARGDVVAAGTIENRGSGSDFFVVKLAAASGAERWRQEIAGTAPAGVDQALAVAFDAAGNVIAGGALENARPGSDFTVIKLAGQSGAELWRATLKGSADGFDLAHAVAVDAAGDVLAAGGITSANTSLDLAVVKLDGASGAELWRALRDGSGDVDLAVSLALDASGDPVATGTTFNPTGFDFTIIKLAALDGIEQWRRDVNGMSSDANAPTDAGFQVAVDAHGDVVAAGFTENVPGRWDFTVLKLNGGDGTSFTALAMPPDTGSSADGCSLTPHHGARARLVAIVVIALFAVRQWVRGRKESSPCE